MESIAVGLALGGALFVGGLVILCWLAGQFEGDI